MSLPVNSQQNSSWSWKSEDHKALNVKKKNALVVVLDMYGLQPIEYMVWCMMQTYQTVGLKGVSNIFASAYSLFEKIIGFCVLFSYY